MRRPDEPGRSLLAVIATLLRRRRLRDDGIEAELRHHLQERYEQLIDSGMEPAAALREAERRFGSVERAQRACRAAQRRGSMEAAWRRVPEQLLRELHFAFRTVRNAPGFALAVVATLALGVGANAAVYSVTDAVLLRPYPYQEPERLVELIPVGESGYMTFLDERGNRALVNRLADEVLWHGRRSVTRTDGEEPERLMLEAVSPNWLDVLGMAPSIGRGFDAGTDSAGDVVILSHEYWRSAFGEGIEALGRTVRLDDRPVMVVGVMPRGFEYPPNLPTDAWIPTVDGIGALGSPLERLEMTARLPDGVTPSAYEERLGARIVDFPRPEGSDDPMRLSVQPLDRFRANRPVRQGLWLVSAGALLLLVIAVANVVNLQLARGLRRRGELSVRRALGASRWRIVRQIVIETSLLAGLAGLVSLVVAELARGWIVQRLPSDVVWFLVGEVRLDHRVLLFAFAVTLAAGLTSGLLPALRLSATDTRAGATGAAAASGGTRRVAGVVVLAQVALAVGLLAAAGALGSSFGRLAQVEVGYEPDRLVTVGFLLPATGYPDAASRAATIEDLRGRAAALPGVEGVAVSANGSPLDGAGFYIQPSLESEDGRVPASPTLLPYSRVEPGYLDVIEANFRAGRDFRPDDAGMSVVIIDQDLAMAFWPEEGAVGRRFRIGRESDWLTVVGVVDDLRLMGPDDRDQPYSMFRPLGAQGISAEWASLVVRTPDPSRMARVLRQLVRDAAPGAPITELATGREVLAETIDQPRFFLQLMGTFSALALGLAAVGVFGVLAAAVRERHREIGIRAALGASRSDLVRTVLRRGALLTAPGLVIGLLGWALVGGRFGELLYQTSPLDPRVLAAAVVAVALTAFVASWLPARRAIRIDPARVLRSE